MTELVVKLPDDLARRARSAGLLTDSAIQHQRTGPVRWASVIAWVTTAGRREASTFRSSTSEMVKVALTPSCMTWIQQSFRFPSVYSQAHRHCGPRNFTCSMTPGMERSPSRMSLNLAAALAGRSLSGALGSGSAEESGYRLPCQ